MKTDNATSNRPSHAAASFSAVACASLSSSERMFVVKVPANRKQDHP